MFKLKFWVCFISAITSQVSNAKSDNGSASGLITNRPNGSPSAYRIGDTFQLVRPQKTLYENYGIVNGVRQCGGVGQVTKWRYETCISGYPPPCAVNSDPSSGENRLEIHFIPSENSDSLGVQARVSAGEEYATFESILANSSVIAGTHYALNVAAGPTEEWRGRLATTHLKLFRESDRKIEICSEADFYVV